MNLLSFPTVHQTNEDAVLPAIMLVEPDTELLTSRSFLLTQMGCAVSFAKSSKNVWGHCSKSEFDVAVLSGSLGLAGLRDSAELVRRRWPQARILVLGCVPSLLDDPLYDEAIDAKFRPEILIETLMRMCRAKRGRHLSISRNNAGEPSTRTENDLCQPSPPRESTSIKLVSDGSNSPSSVA